ncbi:MAG: Nramp family divalent metal transporter [Opitutales bacterium]
MPVTAPIKKNTDDSGDDRALGKRSWWRGLGPGIITASVVIGPGSIVVSSTVGASFGYGMLWALLVTGSFMLLFASMATRVGVLNGKSALRLTADCYGRWLAVLVGVLAFAVCASFQMGNYLACSTALETLTGVDGSLWIGVVGAVAFIFVFIARELYRWIEKVMVALVLVMLASFLANLAIARPDPLGMIGGLVPRGWGLESTGLMIALVATTFSVIAALYQSTLAQQKGWKADDLSGAVRGSLTGVSVLVVVTLMIMITAATVLSGEQIDGAAHLAAQLEPLLGRSAIILFSLGFLAAAFSSTIVNAMIGGGLLADGLGFSSDVNAWSTRVFTGAAMAVGLGAGAWLMKTGTPVEGIVLAQQSTILAVPLCALVLILLANDRRVVGEKGNRWWVNVWAGFAFLVLLGMSVYRGWQFVGGLFDKA